MPLDPRTPVLIGGGQFLHRAHGLDDAIEPADLMVEAVRRATADAGLSAVPAAGALRAVGSLSWKYGNLPFVLAQRLGIAPHDLAITPTGGNMPQHLVNEAAGEISRGELDMAVLVGGEAWRSRMRARREGAELRWAKAPAGTPAARVSGDASELSHPVELQLGVVDPVQVYPMLESALRAETGATLDGHLRCISELWSRFSAVAAGNTNAWLRRAVTAEEVRTPSPGNRMIGLPYTKLMNSNNDVDMAAAVIICSAERAAALGVARDRWVFVHAGADCHEHRFMSNRWSLAGTPGVALAGRRVLELASAGIDDVELVDLYSCFPSAVEIGARSLGLPLDRQLTRTGGLSFAGGPWNNYVMHAVATMIDELRAGVGSTGLIWGNGGYVSKHSFGVYSTEPPAAGYRHANPQTEIDALPRREPAAPESAAGPATIEAYTVMHGRDGSPQQAVTSCLLADGRRAWATSNDPDLATAMCDGEWVGAEVTLAASGTVLG